MSGPSSVRTTGTDARATSLRRGALGAALAPWEKGRGIGVVDGLPTTPTGKPDPLAAAEILMASRL